MRLCYVGHEIRDVAKSRWGGLSEVGLWTLFRYLLRMRVCLFNEMEVFHHCGDTSAKHPKSINQYHVVCMHSLVKPGDTCPRNALREGIILKLIGGGKSEKVSRQMRFSILAEMEEGH